MSVGSKKNAAVSLFKVHVNGRAFLFNPESPEDSAVTLNAEPPVSCGWNSILDLSAAIKALAISPHRGGLVFSFHSEQSPRVSLHLRHGSLTPLKRTSVGDFLSAVA